MSRIILDLCGGTGAWSKPYKDAGYDVRLITLPKHDVRDFEYFKEPIRGILAAPPCTEFSYAKHFHGKGNYVHNFREGLVIVDACLRIIALHQPDWWALENPKGYLSKFLGNPVMMFEPWEYGDDYQKRTCLWGQFYHPKPAILEKPNGLVKFSMLKSKDIYPEYYGKLSRTGRRAITPSGFARAFFEVNQ